jgi:3-oxoacyl-[acyl-carrier protein] reductase
VGDEEQIKATFKAAISQLGKIDIWEQRRHYTRPAGHAYEARRYVVSTPTRLGAFAPSRRSVRRSQRWGRIITSIFGQTGQAGQANYAASVGLIG